MGSTHFILLSLNSNLDAEWETKKFTRIAWVAKFCTKIGIKSETKGIVVTCCRHILFKVLTSKYQQHVSQRSSMFEVWLHVTIAFFILEK